MRARLAALKDLRRYVAEAPDGQVSVRIGVYIFRSVETTAYAEISGLIVDRDQRSRGIGQLLLDAAAKWARRRGCGEMQVRSNVIRRGRIAFMNAMDSNASKTQKLLSKRLT